MGIDKSRKTEEQMTDAFKKAAMKQHRNLSQVVSYGKHDDAWDEINKLEDDTESGSGSFSIANLPQTEIISMIESGNEALQKILMVSEKQFGEVSTDRRGRRDASQGAGLQQQSGYPHHPLLSNTQRFDGMSPEESPEATVNPEAADLLDEHLESNPELVNNPQLRAVLEQRKQMKAQMANTKTFTPN